MTDHYSNKYTLYIIVSHTFLSNFITTAQLYTNRMTSLSIITIVCGLFLIGVYCNNTIPLPVLLLLPYPDTRQPDSGWDKGLELLPAARVAVNEINNRHDVLPGYELILHERQSEACGRTVFNNGLKNFVKTMFHTNTTNDIVAVLGLVCSQLTEMVSSLTSRKGVSMIQLAMANSDNLRNIVRFPHLWRMISSVRDIVRVAVLLMGKFDWNKLAQIHDREGTLYQKSATLFRDMIRTTPGYVLLVDMAIDDSASSIDSALSSIHTTRARIIFTSATIQESGMLICEAAKRNMTWPSYIWIVHSQTFADLYNVECTAENYHQALENVILIDFALGNRSNSEILVSGQSYGEYLAKYHTERERVYKAFKEYLNEDRYSRYHNVMYDQVWSIALAINSSLQLLHS